MPTPDPSPTSPAPQGVHPSATNLRIGHGYDLHRLEPLPPTGKGRPLILGGVRLAHDKGPISHSDGDALYHAVTDAILGALGEPDIGQLFPDTEERHESENSLVFLKEAAQRAAKAGFTVASLDVTVILERPKLSPHKDLMRSNLAAALGVPVAVVNVKGKTHEKVDAVGEGRAVEVHCTLPC